MRSKTLSTVEEGSHHQAAHLLSNGASIYHFSGNVSEWVKSDYPSKDRPEQVLQVLLED